jgi:hypothetical protein
MLQWVHGGDQGLTPTWRARTRRRWTQNLTMQQQQNDLKYGVVTINEVRSERGQPPAPWGDCPGCR